MKGIILAGGTGSRLYPLTQAMNKHLLPIGKYPMIYHSIHKLRQAGMNEILIITGRQHLGLFGTLLGNGQELNVNLTYKVQEKAGGIAQALALAEGFVQKQPMTVLLGDNIFSDNLHPYVNKFLEQGSGAKVLLSKVNDPHRYGVPAIKDYKVVSIEEKPRNPKSHYAVTGIYMYDHRVFEMIRKITPSKRGEMEITDVNNSYIDSNLLTYDILKGWWVDAGTHESLLLANELALDIDIEKY